MIGKKLVFFGNVLLMDDGTHTEPTKDNILAAYAEVVEKSKAGDAVFCHFSGHGSRVKDLDGDEGTTFCAR